VCLSRNSEIATTIVHFGRQQIRKEVNKRDSPDRIALEDVPHSEISKQS